MDGKHEYRPRKGRGHVLQNTGVTDDDGSLITMEAKDIPHYFTPLFWFALDIYFTDDILDGRWPYAGGYMDQPWMIPKIIVLFRREQRRIECEKNKDS